jgi:hypothetical protein
MLLLVMNTLALIFEVLDKEPSIGSIWLAFLLVAVVGYLLCRWRWRLIALTLPAALLLSFGWLTELLDPYVGPAMWQESPGYVIQSYAAMASAVALPCAGALLRRRRERLRGAAT